MSNNKSTEVGGARQTQPEYGARWDPSARERKKYKNSKSKEVDNAKRTCGRGAEDQLCQRVTSSGNTGHPSPGPDLPSSSPASRAV